jgi:hypothetical protein
MCVSFGVRIVVEAELPPVSGLLLMIMKQMMAY